MKTTSTLSKASFAAAVVDDLWLPQRFRELDVETTIVKSQSFQRHSVRGVARDFALPITFTPFASVAPCTARCKFCSEALLYKHATQLSASLRPGAGYGAQLRSVFSELRGLPLGLSLSGLEATMGVDWLLDVLQASREFQGEGGEFDEKILYSNGTGLAPQVDSSREVLMALASLGLDRVEMSRHSPDQLRNDAIMNYRPGVAVAATEVFESAVRQALEHVPVKLVCVVQRRGVDSIETVERYLEWASRLGVKTVVFRELSRLHDLYKPNVTSKYVEEARVPIEPLVDGAVRVGSGFRPVELTEGYYYWNLRCRWENKLDVIFETSDYARMKSSHRSDAVYKLVFHANGNLCADWDPNTHILMKAAE